MDLILWRHALDQHLPDSCRILTSPAQRAQQTVQVLKRRSRTLPDLAQGATVSAVLAASGWPDSREPVLIVAHQPTLGAVAAFLLSGQEASWSMRKGAVWWLSNRVREGTSAVVLKAMIGPDFVCGAAQPGLRTSPDLTPSLHSSTYG
jgi:phosphohistidine phosphatase